MSLLVEQPTEVGLRQPLVTGPRHYPGRKWLPSDIPVDGYLRVSMSREEFLELDYEIGKAEWVDGEAFLMPPARNSHSFIVARLLRLIITSLNDVMAIPEIMLPMEDSIRVPDIVIIRDKGYDPNWRVGRPIVVGEVLSPSTRRFDLGPKAAEYQVHGIGQYWIVDPVAESVEVRVNTESEWRTAVVVDAEYPEAEIAVENHGVVRLEHAAIFG
ncbi:MAG: Uma2 family endonuclease [Promicromonosporaceae bacterium]|nr:Uma2 family endonuclease [Promicromonosporaceae bacterium]